MKPRPRIATESAPRSLSILGATGSIGCNTVKLVQAQPEKFIVKAITAHENVERLAKQARELNAELAVIGKPELYNALRDALSGSTVEIAAGPDALLDAASLDSDIVIAAIVGAAGLAPTLAAIRRGATIGLANKECLVCAGELMMQEVRRHNAALLPVDSEHSAIFQSFDFAQAQSVERIILTGSGGPFRTHTPEQMQHVTPEQAIKHPNWNMGAKISADSATLMNKGLELIEAYHLFPVTPEQIEIVIHPESVVHGMVAYKDGSILAQMAAPDMRTPIAYALSWPQRMECATARLDFVKLGKLTFEAPDEARFPALALARQALAAGGTAPAILNAANEIAVDAFLKGKIGFMDIARIIASVLGQLPAGAARSLDDIMEADQSARLTARKIIAS